LISRPSPCPLSGAWIIRTSWRASLCQPSHAASHPCFRRWCRRWWFRSADVLRGNIVDGDVGITFRPKRRSTEMPSKQPDGVKTARFLSCTRTEHAARNWTRKFIFAV